MITILPIGLGFLLLESLRDRTYLDNASRPASPAVINLTKGFASPTSLRNFVELNPCSVELRCTVCVEVGKEGGGAFIGEHMGAIRLQ